MAFSPEQTRRHLREFANLIAQQVAAKLGIPFVPRCARITRRRGYNRGRTFSVPMWAAKDTDFFCYYVAHEVTHSAPYVEHSLAECHGPRFRQAEQQAMDVLGLELVYANAGKGPYPHALKVKATGQVKLAVDCGQGQIWSQP